jgi:predicted RNase H-like nuclease
MGKPRDPNSNCGRVREFFKANPDEELTKVDMQIKFGLTECQVNTVLRALHRQSAIKSIYCRLALYRGVE